ncbi:MAG: HAMP domain-containing protein [bacterium]|nr:HAMP domain-containing protein [bacterium]
MARQKKFRKTMALKLAFLIETLLIVAIIVTTYVNVNRETESIENDVKARMSMITGLIQRAYDKLSPEDFDGWIQDIYKLEKKSSKYGSEIIYVLILTGQEEVLYSSHNPRYKPRDDEGRPLQPKSYYRINAPNMDKVDAYITEPGTTKARYMVSVGYSIVGMKALIDRAVLSAVLISLAFIFIGLIVAIGASVAWTKPIRSLVKGMKFVEEGDYSKDIPQKRKDELGQLTYSYNIMIEGLRDREFIKNTFKRYVTKQVAEKILESKEEINLAGEKREVTVIFTDIEGFTSISEKMPPHKVVAMLNEYLAIMIDVVFLYEGSLDKFLGDGIMAYWNAPVQQENAALLAAIATTEMQHAIDRLNFKRTSRGEEPIFAGIGVNTGEAVAGNIGSEKKMEYTVIGDNVNLAQRIEVQTDRGQVLLSESTYKRISQYVFATPLPPSRVKGKAEPVTIYLLHGLNERCRPFIKSEYADELITKM